MIAIAAIAAKEAKEHFGKLMDTVQREPVTIEKHGRAVAVVISQTEYDLMKLERLQARLAIGEGQLDRGETIDGQKFFQEMRDGKR